MLRKNDDLRPDVYVPKHRKYRLWSDLMTVLSASLGIAVILILLAFFITS